MADDDYNELPYVMNRLKAVTTGCEVNRVFIDSNLVFVIYPRVAMYGTSTIDVVD